MINLPEVSVIEPKVEPMIVTFAPTTFSFVDALITNPVRDV
jgi:hypothetical protein